MTLGCGGYGGNITSDNISPRHLLNIKRLAYEVTPVVSRWDRASGGTAVASPAASAPAGSRLPSAPAVAAEGGISADSLSRRIDQFLGSRGFKTGSDRGQGDAGSRPASAPAAGAATSDKPLDFVSEEDVRVAVRAGRKLVVAERAIITPAARDLGDQHRVFVVAPWRG
jgi:hypothetical protein